MHQQSEKALTSSVCGYGALRRAMRSVGQLYDQALAPTGINTAQFNLLRTVEKLGNPTQSELASDMVMDLSALGHTLKPLIRDGFLSLEKDPGDGRRRIVTLTKDGRDKLKEAKLFWKPTQRRFESTVGTAASNELLALLDHLASPAFRETFSK
ncbi:Transcriptional regulator, MarR family [Paraburkholderia sabiae]|uniref:MarR family winged helix-turn-helix transcriptional regulator n=1 Tax=Paraburkholderia sabiae TaxID=273251 RepID=UPI001CADA5D0|nr:MarR family transcriptional regulator [Paraburkholderia sabiae]CAG9229825.1 Transcriptional regulator, MarR family [Paraburkholderia sabiae]